MKQCKTLNHLAVQVIDYNLEDWNQAFAGYSGWIQRMREEN